MTDPTTGRTASLYRNADGHEVWAVREADGTLVADDVASDHDAAWLVSYTPTAA